MRRKREKKVIFESVYICSLFLHEKESQHTSHAELKKKTLTYKSL